MQRIIFIFLVICLISSLWAEEQTLVKKDFESGGYGGPVWKLSSINGHSALLTGGRGGWILNHIFVIGVGGYSLSTEVKADPLSQNDKPLYIELYYGGLELEYIHNSDNMLHWTFHTLLGGGSVDLLEHDPENKIESDNLFVIEPSLNADLNITNWFRLGMGISYRLVTGITSDHISNSELSGFGGLLILKFGKF
jgi:hypothetical protein